MNANPRRGNAAVRKVHADARITGMFLVLAFVAAVLAGGAWSRVFFAVTIPAGLAIAAFLYTLVWRPMIKARRIRLDRRTGSLLFIVAIAAAIVVGGARFRLFFALAIPAGLSVAAILHLGRKEDAVVTLPALR
jgi:hypothetical protein